MKPFPLRLVTPTREVFNGEVEHVKLPGVYGHFGVLSSHAPLLAVIDIGAGMYREPGGTDLVFALTGGYAEVLPEGVTVIARTIELPEDIDVDRADEALHRAEDRIKDHAHETDLLRARESASRARLRLTIAKPTAKF